MAAHGMLSLSFDQIFCDNTGGPLQLWLQRTWSASFRCKSMDQAHSGGTRWSSATAKLENRNPSRSCNCWFLYQVLAALIQMDECMISAFLMICIDFAAGTRQTWSLPHWWQCGLRQSRNHCHHGQKNKKTLAHMRCFHVTMCPPSVGASLNLICFFIFNSPWMLAQAWRADTLCNMMSLASLLPPSFVPASQCTFTLTGIKRHVVTPTLYD